MMSKLSEYLKARTKDKDVGKEYEEAYRSGKIFNITMNKAVLGKATKEEIEHAIILMQSSLEIVKACNGSTTKDIELGVNNLFGTLEEVKGVEEVKKTSKTGSRK